MCFSPFVFHYNHYTTLRAEVNIQNAQISGKIFVHFDEINHLTKSAAVWYNGFQRSHGRARADESKLSPIIVYQIPGALSSGNLHKNKTFSLCNIPTCKL
jgi:hypothetical protein